MRKYPPAAYMPRRTQEDYHIPGTDIIIEKGTKVIIPVIAIQHDIEYYPNPQQFNPDRFSREEKKKRDPMTWLAFGGGPRNW